MLTPCITRLRRSSKQRRTTESALLLRNISALPQPGCPVPAVTFRSRDCLRRDSPVIGSALMFTQKGAATRQKSKQKDTLAAGSTRHSSGVGINSL